LSRSICYGFSTKEKGLPPFETAPLYRAGHVKKGAAQ
jgi:hypothetical protein